MSATKTFVSETNSYSVVSKWSTVNKGYIEDDYIAHFVDNVKSNRSPIINHGYWVRAEAIREAFQQVTTKGHNLIISLGCGFDTSAFRYPQALFIELDYRNVCERKADIITRKNLLPSEDIRRFAEHDDDEHDGLVLASPRYLLFAADLTESTKVVDMLHQHRDLIIESVSRFFHLNSFESLNVILFNECSLCYIPKDQSDALIRGLVKAVQRDIFGDVVDSIVYLGYEMLRSNTSRNDFANFMLNHFRSLHAPILTFLNENEIIERFREELAFADVKIINMKQMLRNANSNLKRKRPQVLKIEPFDEIEELDNVCSVYALTIASTKKVNVDVLQPPAVEEKSLAVAKSIELTTIPTNISLHGHCSLFDDIEQCFYIFGGFGVHPNQSKPSSERRTQQHQRLSSVIKLSIDNVSGQVVDNLQTIECSAQMLPSYQRIHARVVRLKANKFLLSGGRNSPAKIMDNVVVSIVDKDRFELETSVGLNQSATDNATTIKAYRHVFSKFGAEQPKLIQFGGITSEDNSNYYNHVHILDIETMQWQDVRLLANEAVTLRRHSMAFTTFGASTILVNGGLDLAEDFVGNSMQVFDQRDNVVRSYDISGLDDRFYSHQLKCLDPNEVLLVGGVGSSTIDNVVYRIDMRQLAVIDRFQLRCADETLMLFNFTCELYKTDLVHLLYTLGGGGNCFSFGTHFNPTCTLDVSKCY